MTSATTRNNVWLTRTVLIHVCIWVVITLSSCGGGGAPSNVTPPPFNPGSTAPTPGQYLIQSTSSGSGLWISSIDSNTGALASSNLLTANTYLEGGGIAITPSKKFLYAPFTTQSEIQGFKIYGPGVKLSQNTSFPSPFTNDVVMDATGKYLYVIQSQKVEQFAIDGSGQLTSNSSIPMANIGSVAVTPSGSFLYTLEMVPPQIHAYKVNESSGALSELPGSPFALNIPGTANKLAIVHDGRFLYASVGAATPNAVVGFTIDTSTGALTVIPGSPFPISGQPTAIVTSPTGNFVYVGAMFIDADTGTNGVINGFIIDGTTGVLTSIQGLPLSTPAWVSSLAFVPSGQFLLVGDHSANGTTPVFTVDASSGALSAVAGSPFPAQQQWTNCITVLTIP